MPRPVNPDFHVGEWVTITDMLGAQHYVAEHGWMLSRVQNAGYGRWLWSVSTTTYIMRCGTETSEESAKDMCQDTIVQHYASVFNEPASR